MVHVLNVNGQPLMPTENHAKVRILLSANKAKVIEDCPFTIQLLYEVKNKVQDITLGVDAGSKTIGLSASTDKKELYASEVTLRNNIVDLISTKRQYRRSRRNRKLRYRKSRFLNRIKSKHKGWLAPSVENKIQTHFTAVNSVCKILPISKIVIEVASFDIQKSKTQIFLVLSTSKVNNLIFGMYVNTYCSEITTCASVVRVNLKTKY